MILNTYIGRLEYSFITDIGNWLPINYSQQFSSTISYNGTFNIIMAFCPRFLFSSDTKLAPFTSVTGRITAKNFWRFLRSSSTLGPFSRHVHRVRAFKLSIKLGVMTIVKYVMPTFVIDSLLRPTPRRPPSHPLSPRTHVSSFFFND